MGPTLGFVVGACTAILTWPAGVLVYLCNRPAANRCFSAPVNVWRGVAAPIPF
jgi:hypothetical protein